VQRELSSRGELRAVKFPDLLIAATVERHGLVVIHYDSDYDRIAGITGQPVGWVVPAGSVP
jgi:predicted nucleic acid-binding protein